MINISVQAKTYTYDELRAAFKKRSDNPADFDEFMAAMIKTGQLEDRRGVLHPTQVTTETTKTSQYRDYNTMLYGGKRTARYPRLAIRAKLTDERTDPIKMYLSSYQDRKGEWHRIPEKPALNITRGRSNERWRANIPSEIIHKYRLKIDTPLRIRTQEVTKRFYSRLTLWGYQTQGMTSFGETGAHKDDRHLELRSEDFTFEVNGPIQAETETAGNKIITVTRKWLDLYDKEYSAFFDRSIVTQHTGIDLIPLEKSPKGTLATIIFEDLDKGRVLADAQATLPKNWVEKPDDNTVAAFFLKTDRVVHGYKGRDRTFRVKDGKERKTRKYTPYSTQATLNLPNVSGFKRKK